MNVENTEEYARNSVSSHCKETAMFILALAGMFALGIALF